MTSCLRQNENETQNLQSSSNGGRMIPSLSDPLCRHHPSYRRRSSSIVSYSLRGLHPSNRPRSPSTLSCGVDILCEDLASFLLAVFLRHLQDVTFVVHRLTAHRRWRCCPPNQTCPSQLIPSILPYPTTTQGPSTTKKSASRVQESIFSSHGGRAGPCRLW